MACSYGCNDHFAPGSLGWCALRNRRCLLSFCCNFMSHLICTVHGNTARLLAAYYNHLEARHQTVHGLDVNDGAAAPWRQALSLSADPLRGFMSSAQSVLCGSLHVTRWLEWRTRKPRGICAPPDRPVGSPTFAPLNRARKVKRATEVHYMPYPTLSHQACCRSMGIGSDDR